MVGAARRRRQRRNRYTLTRRLTREGYTNLTTATNVVKHSISSNLKQFDLILLDIMMPI